MAGRAGTRQLPVGGTHGRQLGLGEVGHQRRLIDLHPLRIGLGEQAEQLFVEGQQVGQPLEQVAAVHRLGQLQEGDRADNDRAGRHAQGQRFAQLGQRLLRMQGERGVRGEFGHQVVVVGIEPLGHLQRRHLGVAPSGREVAIQLVGDPRHPLGQRPEQHGGVEHLVVVGERAHRHRIQPGVTRRGQLRGAQARRDSVQALGIEAPGPVGLGSAFELPVGADTR